MQVDREQINCKRQGWGHKNTDMNSVEELYQITESECGKMTSRLYTFYDTRKAFHIGRSPNTITIQKSMSGCAKYLKS